jgi:CubicO group peptidase (beta-lactamase class C family)
MSRLEESIDRIAAETGFSGVVRVDRGGEVELAKAYGFAHRGYGIATRSTPSSGSPAAPRGSPR